MSQQHTDLSQKHKEPIISPMAVIAAGLASVVAAIVTSRFGVAETLIGEALTAMITAAVPAVSKAYLDRMRNATAGAQILRSVVRVREALGWFFSLPPEGRRPILLGGLLAGVAAFLLGMGTVTAAELSAGKNLHCWIWGNCPQSASEETLPSVMGGGPSHDSSWLIGGDLGNDEVSVAREGPGDDRVPMTTDGAEEDTAPSTITESEETKKSEPCDVKEATTGSAKKDAKPTTATTADGKNKGPKHCADSKTVPNAPDPKPCVVKEATGGGVEKGVESPTTLIRDDDKSKGPKPCTHGQAGPKDPEPPEPKEPSGRTTQRRDEYTYAHDSHRGESPVQEEDSLPEQPRREAGTQNDRSQPEAVEFTNGGGA